MGKIIEIPFSKNLIEFIAEGLIERGKGDFSQTAVVFSHQRPALYLRQAMAERLSHPFFPPRIFSMDDFMEFLAARVTPGLTLVNNLDAAYLLFQAVARIPDNPWQKKDSSFNQFLFWGLRLAMVMEELDIEMVDDESLRGIQMGDLWEPNVAKNAGILMNHLAEIRKIYHTFLEEHHLTTRGRNYAIAAENIENPNLNPFEEVYFAGLFAMTRSEKRIIRHLLGQPGVNLIRQNDGTRRTPFEEMEGWGVETEHRTQNPEGRPKVFLYKAFNTHSEVLGLRDALIGERASGERTAVVLPEPEPLIPLLSEVMTTLAVDYNISMGYPAVRTPVYALLDLFIRLQESKRGNAYYLPDYLSFLMHPYLKNIHHKIESSHTRILIHSIEEVLLDQGKTFIGLDEIEEKLEIFEKAARMAERKIPIQDFREALHNIHHIFIRKVEGLKTLGGLSISFEEILSYLLRYSPAAHYPFSGEFFRNFFSLLNKIKDSLIKDEVFEQERDLFDLFRHLAKGEYIPFVGIPLKGLQILGLLETRCLNFDRVYLLSANEEILPAVSPLDSLLPLALRAALGIPLHYQEEEIYDYHFQHLILSAQEVHIFYRETEKEFRSRFVEKLVWEEEKKRGKLGVLGDRPLELNVTLRPSLTFEMIKTSQILEVLHKINFSATGLNYYLECPAKFYFAKVLGLEEKEEASELDAARVGDILHHVMERLYQPFAGQGILGEEEYAGLEKNLGRVLEDVFLEKFGQIRGEQFLLKEVAHRRILEFILLERERFMDNISIISAEEDLSCSLKLSDETVVWLKGRVDRIECSGEEHIITDYKSGRDLGRHSYNAFDKVYNSRNEMKEEIGSLQLPLYALLYQRTHSVEHGRINPKMVSLQRPEEEEFLFDKEINRQEFLERVFLPTIKSLISEILNPKIPFVADDKGGGCQFCPFSTLCRKPG